MSDSNEIRLEDKCNAAGIAKTSVPDLGLVGICPFYIASQIDGQPKQGETDVNCPHLGHEEKTRPKRDPKTTWFYKRCQYELK